MPIAKRAISQGYRTRSWFIPWSGARPDQEGDDTNNGYYAGCQQCFLTQDPEAIHHTAPCPPLSSVGGLGAGILLESLQREYPVQAGSTIVDFVAEIHAGVQSIACSAAACTHTRVRRSCGVRWPKIAAGTTEFIIWMEGQRRCLGEWANSTRSSPAAS
ncbi:hypothetical protein BJY00DRAFT_192727 [Aspergillus carlsbadensis]|nr:hypothetical protein BJY00DRAFT_192727 [Aspergillus carlsbadensis]